MPTEEPRFGDREERQAELLIEQALEEDLPGGDATTDPLFDALDGADTLLEVSFVARAPGVLAGLPVVELLFSRAAPDVALRPLRSDGESLEPGASFLSAKGRAADILRLERTALNFLQRLCGIATTVATWVHTIRQHAPDGREVALLDTRKTTPAWRYLEKYAVRCGGGRNHRMNLSDGIMLKDNHLALLRRGTGGRLADWVRKVRERAPRLFVQVEVDTPEEYREALDLPVDAILLDNFTVENLRWAVETRDAVGRDRPLLEASGGIQLADVGEIASTGVDRISVGALTHSAAALDIGLDYVRADDQP